MQTSVAQQEAEREANLIQDIAAFNARFPLPPTLQDQFSLEGKRAFARSFMEIRNAVEDEHYAKLDQESSPGERTRKFLGAMVNPIIGKPMRDAEHFYQTFGRLMRFAWLSISVGLYDEAIQAIPDTAERLILAQVHTVDTNWRPAVSQIAAKNGGRGLIVEVGTGRGNSVARLAQLLPETRIVSVTISPEQHKIVSETMRRMNLHNVEVRLGDIFDPTVTDDLVGQADAAGAIEVVLHFPKEKKLQGMQMLTRLLKPDAPMCIIDSAIAKPLSAFSERYYANQSIYFGLREQYFRLFDEANLEPTSYVDYTPDMNQAFKETTTVLRARRAQLRAEFGRVMSWLWPEVPGTIYIQTLKNIRYVHAVAIKR